MNNIFDNTTIGNVLIKLKALENLLIDKNLATKDEIQLYIDNASDDILKLILKNANVPGDLDKILSNLKNSVND